MDVRRISVSSFPLIQQPLPQALATIREAGFGQVDLLGRMPHLSLDPAECDLNTVKLVAAEAGVRIANLGTYAGNDFASPDSAAQEADLRAVKRSVDAAVALGARTVRVFRWNSPADDPAMMARITPYLQRATRYAAEKGIYIGMENHGGRLSGVPELCCELVLRVGLPNFGIIYDPCNLIRGGADPEKAFHTMKNHIILVHFKDGTSDPNSHRTTPLGAGLINFKWILQQLDSIGYDREITYEYELDQPAVPEGLRIARAFFEGL